MRVKRFSLNSVAPLFIRHEEDIPRSCFPIVDAADVKARTFPHRIRALVAIYGAAPINRRQGPYLVRCIVEGLQPVERSPERFRTDQLRVAILQVRHDVEAIEHKPNLRLLSDLNLRLPMRR